MICLGSVMRVDQIVLLPTKRVEYCCFIATKRVKRHLILLCRENRGR